ncbi:amidohydrolase family protein [Roseobacter weihaiensis]|uniref:amidohydrolase family protein n=1 Tax=Roseobacter weihaiensis TaxID=2763262 RepID=UPI001D0B6DB3|nr:amidohydrolase family protein [Roseobacter sp. H9]
MIIDAHQHFWTLARGDYAWPNETVAPIFRDFTPDDLYPLLKQAGVEKTILVQATDTVAETEFLLTIAAQTDFVAGVVGWVDLTAPDAIATIDRLRRNPMLKGLRPMLQSIPDTDWILQDAAQPALAHMAAVDLSFDALIQPRHLSVIAKLAQRYPSLGIVVDHIAKPQIGAGQGSDQTFQDGIRQVASCENVLCKLSGMVTEAGPDWTPTDLTPYAQTIIDRFGAERVMFGSDWPVVNLAGDYGKWISYVQALLAPLRASARHNILAGTAQRFYRV